MRRYDIQSIDVGGVNSLVDIYIIDQAIVDGCIDLLYIDAKSR